MAKLLSFSDESRGSLERVILFGREFWSRLIDFDYLADCGLIRDEHLALFEFADTPEEAWQWIQSFEAERASDEGDCALAA